MSAPIPADGLDWHLLLTIVSWVGAIAIVPFAWIAKVLWSDVQTLKGSWLTRDEFNNRMDEVHKERESKHSQSLGNFGVIHEKVNALNTRVLEGQVVLERRLGDVAATIATLRPHRPDGGPERRRGY